MNNGVPLDVLQQRAAEQRDKIDASVRELKDTVTENVRETLDFKRHARERFWPLAGGLSLAALVFGYALAGVFVD